LISSNPSIVSIFYCFWLLVIALTQEFIAAFFLFKQSISYYCFFQITVLPLTFQLNSITKLEFIIQRQNWYFGNKISVHLTASCKIFLLLAIFIDFQFNSVNYDCFSIGCCCLRSTLPFIVSAN
jgi:hypothetical protein